MKEIIFALAFFFTSGNVIDTNFKLHKYDKENFKKIYYKFLGRILNDLLFIRNRIT